MSGRQVLVDAALLERLISPEITTGQNPEDWYDCRHCGSHWTSDTPEFHAGFCPVPVLQAALTAPVGSMENPIDLPPTTPDKPEPEQEALESLEYWLETGTASNSDRCAMEQATRTVAAAYRAALHKVPQAPAEEAKP